MLGWRRSGGGGLTRVSTEPDLLLEPGRSASPGGSGDEPRPAPPIVSRLGVRPDYRRSAPLKATESLAGMVTVAVPPLPTRTVGPEQAPPLRLPWMMSQ